MKIVWPNKMSLIVQAAFNRFLQVEDLCDSLKESNEGIGKYAHAWITLASTNPEDLFETMSALAKWPAYISNADINTAEAYVFPNRDTYYVFFSTGNLQAEIKLIEFINKAALEALRETLNSANNQMVRALGLVSKDK